MKRCPAAVRYDGVMAASDTRVLAGVPLFHGLDRAALAAVATDARTVRVAPGRAFFREGEPARVFFVLTRGRVKFTQTSADGHEVILRVTGPGEPFGGIAAFADGGSYPVTARAVEASEAHAWDGPHITALMRRFPEIGINAARLVA